MPEQAGRNPFHIHGVVDAAHFTDRAEELARMGQALAEPGSKLVVFGPRRMGKTSALVRALERHRKKGGVGFLADLSTASSLADVANRVLEAAGRALGRKWKDAIQDLIQRLGVSLSLTPDPTTGLILPSLDVGLRSAPLATQQTSLARTLDAIDALAADRGMSIGVALDEFQEVRQFGGEKAEWHLRSVIQHHRHASYLLAGSEAGVIEGMLDKGRAFYALADQLHFGPIAEDHLARWIDDRMRAHGIRSEGAGQAAVIRAGPRTRDIVQVARQCFERCRAAGQPRAAAEDIAAALEDVVADQAAVLLAVWGALPSTQQNVLRAVAADREGLTTRDSLRRFALPSSGAAVNAAQALLDAGHLIRGESRTGYGFESPFFAAWVASTTLADLGAAESHSMA